MDLKEILWALLKPTETKGTCIIVEGLVDELYHNGFVDTKRISLNQWKGAFKSFPKTKEGFLLTQERLAGLAHLLYQAPIKKPFDPNILKDGTRPQTWLLELYQKVIQFETTLTLENWKWVIANQIEPEFKQKDKIRIDFEFKEFLLELLDHKPSTLRKLETFCHEYTSPKEAKKKEIKPTPIQDKFVAKPEEINKQAAIDKLYYHYEQQPKVDDKDQLSFLDEIADLEDDDDEKL